eukprot:2001982-Rhodomonas_salina.3
MCFWGVAFTCCAAFAGPCTPAEEEEERMWEGRRCGEVVRRKSRGGGERRTKERGRRGGREEEEEWGRDEINDMQRRIFVFESGTYRALHDFPKLGEVGSAEPRASSVPHRAAPLSHHCASHAAQAEAPSTCRCTRHRTGVRA